MPYLYKNKGGKFTAGHIEGVGEEYYEDNDGNGQVYKGNFTRGKLNCVDGVYINYTNESFTMYEGTFINGVMDGTITVTTFVTSVGPDGDTGNGPNKKNGLVYLNASRSSTPLAGTQSDIVFSNGTQGAVLSTVTKNITVHATQRLCGGSMIFDDLVFSAE